MTQLDLGTEAGKEDGPLCGPKYKRRGSVRALVPIPWEHAVFLLSWASDGGPKSGVIESFTGAVTRAHMGNSCIGRLQSDLTEALIRYGGGEEDTDRDCGLRKTNFRESRWARSAVSYSRASLMDADTPNSLGHALPFPATMQHLPYSPGS